jgi:hypothetical protein
MLENNHEKIPYRKRRHLAPDDGCRLCANDDIEHLIIDIHDNAGSCCTTTGHAEHNPEPEFGRWQWQHDGVEENHLWQCQWCRKRQQLDHNDAIPRAAGIIEQLLHDNDHPIKLEFNMTSYKSGIRLLASAALLGGMTLLAGCGSPATTTTTSQSTTAPAMPPPPTTTTTSTTNTQSTP